MPLPQHAFSLQFLCCHDIHHSFRNFPATIRRGYGIRYRYGMFKQAIKDGLQVSDSGLVFDASRAAECVLFICLFIIIYYIII